MLLHRNPSTIGRSGNDTSVSRGRPERFGPSAWWRADVGITTATGVSQWAPIVGGGNLTQGTGGKQPALITSGSNGCPAVRGDGVDDALGPVAFTRDQPETLDIVYKSVAIGVASVNDVIIDGNATLTGGAFLSDATPQYYIFAGAAACLVSSLVANGVYAFVTAQYNGASSLMRVNGVQVKTGNAGSAAAAGLTLFSRGGTPGGWSNSEIAEVCIYNRLKDASEMALSDNYHRARYGLT